MVIVALGVQHAVHDQMGEVVALGVFRCDARFRPHHRHADDDVGAREGSVS